MNDTTPEWVYETLRNDDLRVYENSSCKIIISQVNERHKDESMTPQQIIYYLKGIRRKPVVMHPGDPFIGRHVPKGLVIEILQKRMEE